MISGGTYTACGDGKATLSQRGVNGSAHGYFFLHSKCQAETEKELQSSTHDDKYGSNPSLDPDRLLFSLPNNYKDLQEYLLTNPDMFPTWSDDIKRFIALACEACCILRFKQRIFYVLNNGYPTCRGMKVLYRI